METMRSLVPSLPANGAPWKRPTTKMDVLLLTVFLVFVYQALVLIDRKGPAAPYETNPSFVVKTIVVPSRIEQASDNLHNIFPHMEFIRAFNKTTADLQMMESAKTLDRSWDDDGHLRDVVYTIPYPQAGEVSCTMSHRRALESFLAGDAETMLVLEDDAVALADNIREELEDILAVAPADWNYINLGRCWDICDMEKKEVVANFGVTNAARVSRRGTLERGTGWEMCTHAYLVNRAGAETLLQYSQPMILPYDHNVNILARQGLLNIYITSPRLFIQSPDFNSLLRSKESSGKPVCDPFVNQERINLLKNEAPKSDNYIMERMKASSVQNMVSRETLRIQDAATPELAENLRSQLIADLCSRGKNEFCVDTRKVHREISQHCSMHGGTAKSASVSDYPAAVEFLSELDRANLDGVIIWGLRPEADHSHRYVHDAIRKAVEFALDHSPVPRHLCHVKETPGFDIGTYLYKDSSRGKMARSLVFGSPKHMTWSDDMGFVMMPVEETSNYVFHGMTPRPHQSLKRLGRAAEWEAWGPDGHIPIFDSQEFVRGDVWRPHNGCQQDTIGKHFECADERLVVMPWATEFIPSEIMANKRRIKSGPLKRIEDQKGMEFIGSIWYCNLEEFVGFTKGCLAHNITVTRHGKWILSNDIDKLKELPNFEMKDDLDKYSVEEVFQNSDSIYAPAFQGACHLNKVIEQSYVADRILNVIAMGMLPMTNNPVAVELLGYSPAIVYHENAEELCNKAFEHNTNMKEMTRLMDLVAREHTYLSRLSSLLKFLSGPVKATTEPMTSVVYRRLSGGHYYEAQNRLKRESLLKALKETQSV